MSTSQIETIIGFVCLFSFLIFFFSLSSKKETIIGKIGDGVSNMATSTADFIVKIVQRITEPREKRRRRDAREVLAARITTVSSCGDLHDKNGLKRCLIIDEKFARVLTLFEITGDEWCRLATYIYYLSYIEDTSKNIDVTGNGPNLRDSMINDWYNSPILKESLSYFNIDESEWIKYGYAVLHMHGVYEDHLYQKLYTILNE